MDTLSQETFESLIRSCRQGLTAAAYHLLGDKDAAQDVVQETLVDAYHGFSKLREPEKAKAWLYTILRRKASLYRKKQRPSVELTEDIPSPDSDAVEALVRGIVIDQIGKLPKDDREILAGKYLLGLSYQELAESFGIKEQAVRVRCFRAKERLRASLSRVGVDVHKRSAKAIEGEENGM